MCMSSIYCKGAEKEGLDSLWVFERLLWPIKPKTPYVATPDGSLPVQYQNVPDPLEILTYLAGHTNQISLGTCSLKLSLTCFHCQIVVRLTPTTSPIL